MTKRVKGFPTIDSQEATIHLAIVEQLNMIAKKCGFKPILVPTVETKLFFQKTVGTMSDISQKEFFSCSGPQQDRQDEWVLRPELTTGVVNHLLRTQEFSVSQKVNLFTYGNCFRYENPQHGRYREFYQWNLEQLNFLPSPQHLTLALICLQGILDHFQIKNEIVVEINYLTKGQLQIVKEKILANQKAITFCSLCIERLAKESVYPILDCKKCSSSLTPYLDLTKTLTREEKQSYDQYYQQLQLFLPGVKIVRKNVLTRGLEYYDGLVFEVKIVDYAWSQNTIIAGGMYAMTTFDHGFANDKYGFGFAIGINRFIQFLKQTTSQHLPKSLNVDVPVVVVGYLETGQQQGALLLFQHLLANNIKAHLLEKSASFAQLLKTALTKNSSWLLIVEKEYQQTQKVLLRQITPTQTTQTFQQLLTFSEIVQKIKNYEH